MFVSDGHNVRTLAVPCVHRGQLFSRMMMNGSFWFWTLYRSLGRVSACRRRATIFANTQRMRWYTFHWSRMTVSLFAWCCSPCWRWSLLLLMLLSLLSRILLLLLRLLLLFVLFSSSSASDSGKAIKTNQPCTVQFPLGRLRRN